MDTLEALFPEGIDKDVANLTEILEQVFLKTCRPYLVKLSFDLKYGERWLSRTNERRLLGVTELGLQFPRVISELILNICYGNEFLNFVNNYGLAENEVEEIVFDEDTIREIIINVVGVIEVTG